MALGEDEHELEVTMVLKLGDKFFTENWLKVRYKSWNATKGNKMDQD